MSNQVSIVHLCHSRCFIVGVSASRQAALSVRGGGDAWSVRWKETASHSKTQTFGVLTETDDNMRAIAEKVFASETKDENTRDEISMFDVAEDCPIIHHEMAHHLHTDDNVEKRSERRGRSSGPVGGWMGSQLSHLLINRKRLQRSHTIAVASGGPKAFAAPAAPVEMDTPTYLEVPDFQRVAILGDYASGVLCLYSSFDLKECRSCFHKTAFCVLQNLNDLDCLQELKLLQL